MNLDENIDKRCILILRIAVFFCFAGWAWQHIYWDAPYRELFWSEDFFGGVVSSWGVDWEHYVGNESTDGIIQTFVFKLGFLYLFIGFLALTVKKKAWGQISGLVLGSLLLFLLAYCQYLDKMKYLAQWIEYGGQYLSPLVLILALHFGPRHRYTINLAILAFVMIFVGHGLYAIGAYPTPANFYEMTMNVFPVSESGAEYIIRFAGFMDMIICLALVVPAFRVPALLYGIFWGFVTALARPWAGMSLSYEWWGADQYLHGFFLRFPHFIIPLFLYFVLCRGKETAEVGVDESTSVKMESVS